MSQAGDLAVWQYERPRYFHEHQTPVSISAIDERLFFFCIRPWRKALVFDPHCCDCVISLSSHDLTHM